MSRPIIALRKATRRGVAALVGNSGLRSKKQRDPSWLRGKFTNWRDAVAASEGYDAGEILNAVKRSLGSVRDGGAVYERDSVIFDHVEYSWPILAALMWEAAQNDGRLNVLDVGGSLGTSYYQNRRFLAALSGIRWNIVEQPHYVAEGRSAFETKELRFFESIDACLLETTPTIAILSGVLPYLEKPYDVLSQCLSSPFRTVALDRTSVWQGGEDRLCIQDVPSTILRASYPIWIFSESRLKHAFSPHEIVAEFPGFADEQGNPDCEPKGFIIQCRRPALGRL